MTINREIKIKNEKIKNKNLPSESEGDNEKI